MIITIMINMEEQIILCREQYGGDIILIVNQHEASRNYATNIRVNLHLRNNIYSAPPPNIPMNDSNPGLFDTLFREPIARSYPSSNW